MPKIEILSGKREGESVELPSDGIDIGNRKTAKLSIRDPWISWNHAKIIPEGAGFVIEDLGSSNGTWIAGKKVTRQTINLNEEIFLGKTKIRMVDPSVSASTGSSEGRLPESSGGTTKLARPQIVPSGSSSSGTFSASDVGQGDRVGELERENAELRKMKDVLERFLDLSSEERIALGQASGSAPAPAAAPAKAGRGDTGRGEGGTSAAAEKARQDAVARVIEIEGKLASAEGRVVELENRLKGSADQSKKDLARAREKFEEELGFARVAKTEAETARAQAEDKVRELTKKVETAASDALARVEKLEKDLESARKSGIDADARTQKLERDLDQIRRVKAPASSGPSKEEHAAAQAELATLRAQLAALQEQHAQAHAEREDWKSKHDKVREEIDQISMDQIELEDTLRARIAELEGK